MKKTIFTLLLSVITGGLFAQSDLVLYNGEDVTPIWYTIGSAGQIDPWGNPTFDAVNSTADCISIWRNFGDDDWTGGGIAVTVDPATYKSISLMVLKETAGRVQLELQTAEGAFAWLQKEYTTPGAWQQLDFDIPTGAVNIITNVLVAPHLENTKEDLTFGQRMYWDEIIAKTSVTTSLSPEVSDSKEIISSDVYTIGGKLIDTLNADESLNIDSYVKGVYIVKQTDINGKTYTQKIIR